MDGDLYKVQVGAFSRLENAIRMEYRLRAAGYDTYITTWQSLQESKKWPAKQRALIILAIRQINICIFQSDIIIQDTILIWLSFA